MGFALHLDSTICLVSIHPPAYIDTDEPRSSTTPGRLITPHRSICFPLQIKDLYDLFKFFEENTVKVLWPPTQCQATPATPATNERRLI